jgi:Polyketide cyclase / dehydrase and lipid transport
MSRLAIDRDIAIQNVLGEGDFEHYQGVWRMQALPNCAPDGSNASRLTYAVEIKPKGLLPVKLIEGRIAADLKANLAAIRDYVEKNAHILLENQGMSVDDENSMAVMPSSKTVVVTDSLVKPGEIDFSPLESDFSVQDSEKSTVFSATLTSEMLDSINSAEIMDSSDVDSSYVDSSDVHTDIPESIPSIAAPAILISNSYRRQLTFENEKIQRAVAALEKDLGSALSKIQEIRLLSKTLLDAEAASA